jgi:NAD-dependent deacetylase
VGSVRTFDQFEPLQVGPGKRVFVLTGAGISAESGIMTFRDANGLWEQHRVEEVASPGGWAADPLLVWRFYSQRRAQAHSAAPNAAHRALASLEDSVGDRLFLCTQNVDPLHELAGSRRVSHMHGELMKSRCERNHAPPFDDSATYLDRPSLPRCHCGALVRPHICWFGEVPFGMDIVQRALAACDLFVSIGSSGAVYPAAGFVRTARQAGAKTVYVGPEEPDNATSFDECRVGKAGSAVPSLFREAR